jgi:hypothetical protein
MKAISRIEIKSFLEIYTDGSYLEDRDDSGEFSGQTRDAVETQFPPGYEPKTPMIGVALPHKPMIGKVLTQCPIGYDAKHWPL